MAIILSDELMEAMGFKPFDGGQAIAARFTALRVFSVEGLAVLSAEVIHTTIEGHACGLAMADTVNAACRALLSEDYVDDEGKWQQEKKCSGPYLVAAVGPTHEYTATSGHVIEREDGSITTYDCFPAAKESLSANAEKVLPALLTSWTCQFHALGQHFKVRLVDSVICGETSDGRTLHDIRMQANAHATVASNVASAVVQDRLYATVAMVPKINSQVASFFNAALFEVDLLKRFLYLFLVLEIQTNAAFDSVEHSSQARSIIPSTAPALQAAATLLTRQTANMKNLFDKFVWSTLCVWTSIDDSDVALFKRLKGIRDDITHGTVLLPTHDSVQSVEALAIKVLRQ